MALLVTSPPTAEELKNGAVGREEFKDFLRQVLPNIGQLPESKQIEILRAVKRLEHLEMVEAARENFLSFFRAMNPRYVIGSHHKIISDEFDLIVEGKLDRITISLPPRYTKSEMSSIALPAYYLGRYPDRFIIQASANDELATGFGRKVKNIIESEEYQEIFPGVSLSKDSKASGRFNTNRGGSYYAVGRGGGLAGKGAHLFIGDDVLDEKSILSGGMEVFEKAWEWMQAGPLQRLQPNGTIALIGTRWSKADPIGRVHARASKDPDADKYKKIEIPALDSSGNSTFPEYWPTERHLRTKRSISPVQWAAQYQQQPTATENSIVPKSYWKVWDKTNDDGDYETPKLKFTIMVMDTAYTDNKRSNPSAFTIWGVFEKRNEEIDKVENCILLLSARKRKMEWGELKVFAKRLIGEWKPDRILIEKKSSGPFLISELRKAGILARPVDPKGQDKTMRLNAVSDVFRSGFVYYVPTASNEEVVQEVADFPGGAEDDYTDCTAYAIAHFREGRFVTTNNDRIRVDEDKEPFECPKWY